jgi:hypothetical protein
MDAKPRGWPGRSALVRRRSATPINPTVCCAAESDGAVLNYDYTREFLAGVSAMAAKSGYDPKLMLQPYVWTQQLQSEKVTLTGGLERIFSASQRAGYKRMDRVPAPPPSRFAPGCQSGARQQGSVAAPQTGAPCPLAAVLAWRNIRRAALAATRSNPSFGSCNRRPHRPETTRNVYTKLLTLPPMVALTPELQPGLRSGRRGLGLHKPANEESPQGES